VINSGQFGNGQKNRAEIEKQRDIRLGSWTFSAMAGLEVRFSQYSNTP
jgi:hypothetical protein